MKPVRIDILGTPVDCVTMQGALTAAQEMLRGDRPHSILAVNPEKVIRAREDAVLRGQLSAANLLIPDGIGVVLAGRWLHRQTLERVPGSELMPHLCHTAASQGHAVFLYGAKPDVIERAAAHLRHTYPRLQIAGTQHGYLSDADMPALITRINQSGAAILFVALGSPRQEQWIAQYLPQLSVRIVQGVGGTFDVLAGTVKRAPVWCRAWHLEWLYRLVTNPGRASRQLALPIFAFDVVRHRMTNR